MGKDTLRDLAGVPLNIRCLNKMIVGLPTGCFGWDGAHNPLGYSVISRDGRSVGAHRVAFETLRHPIPEGLQIDHRCRNRGCVNPWHMEPVTRQENVLRSMATSAVNARKTHCPEGHPYDARTRRGVRACTTCRRAAGRRDQLAHTLRRRAADGPMCGAGALGYPTVSCHLSPGHRVQHSAVLPDGSNLRWSAL